MPIVSIVLLVLTFAANFIIDFIFWVIMFNIVQPFMSRSLFPVGHEMDVLLQLTVLSILVPATVSLLGFMQRFTVWTYGGRKAVGDDYTRLFNLLSDIYKRGQLGDPHYYHLYVCNDPTINAFALGNRHIVIHRGAMNQLDDYQLLGVIAHEMGHLQNHHTMVRLCICGMEWFGQVIRLVYRTLLFFCRLLAWIPIVNWFVVIFSWIIVIQDRICGWFLQIPSTLINLFGFRQHEYQADAYAYKIGLGQNIIAFFHTLQRVYGNDKSGFFGSFWQDHPDLPNRIARIEKMMAADHKGARENGYVRYGDNW